jgi:hypothetical protein
MSRGRGPATAGWRAGAGKTASGKTGPDKTGPGRSGPEKTMAAAGAHAQPAADEREAGLK